MDLLSCSPAAAPGITVYQLMGGCISNSLALSSAPTTAQLPLSQQYTLQPTLQPMPNQAAMGVGQQWRPLQQQPRAQQQQQQLPTTVFFAGVTPVADCQRLRLLFSQFGCILDLNLFRPYNGCRTSKGCGLVVFSQHNEAAVALESLNGRFIWPGARSPMVIEWCDPTKQHKKKRAQPLAHSIMQQSATRWQFQQAQQNPLPNMMMTTMSSPAQDAQLQVVYVTQPMY